MPAVPLSADARRSTAERKVRAGFAFALACLVTVGFLSYESVRRLRANAGWVQHTFQVLTQLDRLKALTTDAETAERGYAITGDDDYLANYATAAGSVDQVERELQRLVVDNVAQRQRLARVTQLISERMAALRAVNQARRSSGFAAAQELIRTGPGKSIHDQLDRQAGEIASTERSLLEERELRVARSTTVTQLLGIGGSVLAVLCIAWAALVSQRDLAERRRIEEAVRHARDEADRANEAKSRFLSTASHDLRQPLQTLSLLNGTLRRLVRDGDAAHAFEQQEQAITTMSRLINALLDISRLESGAVRPEIRPFGLDALFAELATEFSEPAARKGLQLEVLVPADATVSDPTLLGQILRNLLGNAVRYTAQGSIRLECRREGERLRIDVIDTGVGIPEDRLRDIFEEFYQVGVSPNTVREGHGLGLSIVKRAARLLDHEVRVTSKLGQGSIFSILVPFAAADCIDPRRQSAVEANQANPRQMHVLLVDDDTAVLNATRLLLKVEGYRVTAASSLDEAVEMARENRDIDLLITDLHLGDGNLGTDVRRSVEEDLGRRISTVLITGDTSATATRVVQDDRLVVARKPIEADELLNLLTKLSA
jgi:two-component system, sensor histidine kinase